MIEAPLPPAGKARSRALQLANVLGDRVREGRFASGTQLPTEAAIMQEFGVSRTVVREALSKLQSAGIVETRHGIGTFAVGLGNGGNFRIAPERLATLRDVIAVLELRIGIETESASLAASRRTDQDLASMRQALDAFARALSGGHDAVGPDFQFHLEIARATHNEHYVRLMETLGTSSIPRSRLESKTALSDEQRRYLDRVAGEHENIFNAIAAQDAQAARAAMRVHLANSLERRRKNA